MGGAIAPLTINYEVSMKVNEVVGLALIRLGFDEEFNLLELNDKIDDKILKNLTRCANFVLNNVATQHLQLRKIEIIQAKNGCINYDYFKEKVNKIVKVSKNKSKIGFKMYPQYLAVEIDGLLEVDYTYIPKILGLDDEIEFYPQINSELLALGICSEYCLLNGRYDESVLYDKKFKEMLMAQLTKKHEIYIKPRR